MQLAAAYLTESFNVCIGKACRLVKLPKSIFYYKNIRDDSVAIDKLLELFEGYPTEEQVRIIAEFGNRAWYGTISV